MGFMLRVRLASFFAGAAAAAAGGGYFLYKDYKLANDSMALKNPAPVAQKEKGIDFSLFKASERKPPAYVKFLSALHDSLCVEGKASDFNNANPQVKGLQDSLDTRYKALEKRLTALEGQQSTGAAPDVDTPSD